MVGAAAYAKEKSASRVIEVNISEIRLGNQSEPMDMGTTAIQSLAESIVQHGILQPLHVHLIDGKYELVKGLHIFQAALSTGMRSVPCVVDDKSSCKRDINDLLEEIRMKNMDFFQEAEAIEKLISLYGITQEDAASRLGRAQSTIANKLRLLRLTETERNMIVQHRLTERHARAILRLGAPEERLAVLNQVIRQNLNVEKTEKTVEMKMGRRKKREPYRKRSRSVQSVHSFIRSLNKAAESMHAAGIGICIQQVQRDGWMEFQIRIPQKKYSESEADNVSC